jgi:hypothetical protein
MPRNQRLKVFRTSIGFHDAYVAAPSRKAALAAWGAGSDLFAIGAAEVVTDPELTSEPLAAPGAVIKRKRGSLAEHLTAAGPAREPRAPAVAPRAKPRDERPPRPKPRPSRAALAQAEAALAEQREAAAAEAEDFAQREAELRRARATAEQRQQQAMAERESEVERLRARYDAAIARWRAEA